MKPLSSNMRENKTTIPKYTFDDEVRDFDRRTLDWPPLNKAAMSDQTHLNFMKDVHRIVQRCES